MDTENAEFQNKILAQIYDDFNDFGEDKDFWLKIIGKLGVNHVTDFGCGTGLLTHTLSELGYSMKGIDPAKPMLLQALKKNKEDSIEYIEGGYEKLAGFTTELVLMTSHVAQFLVDENEWDTFLQNSYNILKEGGYILFDSKNPLLQPWNNYTRKKHNRTKKTKFGEVNMQIEVSEIVGNIITHNIYYKFLATGEELISSIRLVYKTKECLEKSLIENGFEIVKIYGDWQGEGYTDINSEMIFLARKV